MESKRCYMPKCTKNAESFCNCTSSVIFMCQTHVSNHISNKRRLHNIQSIQGINPTNKNLALDLLIEEKSKFSQLKRDSSDNFIQLVSSLKNIIKNIFEILNMNLDSIEQKIKKIKTDELSKSEIDQLLRSLIRRDVSEARKICLIDSKTLKNIEAINNYIKETDEAIIRLNIHKPGDLESNDIEELINQFHSGSLNDLHENLACEIGKCENTIMSWNKDFKNFPKTKENWYFKLGFINYLAGDIYEALSYFNFAIKLNPNYSDSYFYKGVILAGLGRKEESLECWNYLLQANKKFSFINLIKGRVLCLLDRIAESLDVYDQFTQNSSEHYFFNYLKVISLYEEEEENYKEIKLCSEEMIRLIPKFSLAYCDIGMNSQSLKKENEALKWYHKAIENDEQCYLAYNRISFTFASQKNYEQFLDCNNIALAINPFNSTCHNNKGVSLYCLGRDEEALECFKEAIRLNPNLPNAYQGAGIIFYEKEQYEEALRYFDIALKIKPSFKETQDNKMATLLKLEEERKKRF